MLTMPQDANIPYEWQIGGDRDKLVIVFPSWSSSDKTSYAIFMDKQTRELRCECKGFEVNGTCHHVKGVKWCCSHPQFRRKGVTKTSLEAFYALTKEHLAESQQLVLKAVEKLGPVSDKQISTVLGRPINTVTPRRGEIEEMGLIKCAGVQVDPVTDVHVMMWEAVA